MNTINYKNKNKNKNYNKNINYSSSFSFFCYIPVGKVSGKSLSSIVDICKGCNA